jgi:plastocyanin
LFYIPKREIMKKLIGSKSKLLTGTVILFITFTLLNSCTKSSDTMPGTGGNTGGTGGKGGPGTNEVWIRNMAFTPSTITVAAGTTITWTNKDAVTHNVTSNSAVFSSGAMGTGATFSFKFTTTGTYPYSCTIHPSMTATVIVN